MTVCPKEDTPDSDTLLEEVIDSDAKDTDTVTEKDSNTFWGRRRRRSTKMDCHSLMVQSEARYHMTGIFLLLLISSFQGKFCVHICPLTHSLHQLHDEHPPRV